MTQVPPVAQDVRPVILFDGVCHLCNGFVQFVLKHDARGQFRFAPLQSAFAQDRLGGVRLDSVGLMHGGSILYAEHAALAILAGLDRPWRWLARLAAWLPDPLLGWGYRFIASHRYQLFGREESCMLPRPEWKGRFFA